jgi:hypothetical protein
MDRSSSATVIRSVFRDSLLPLDVWVGEGFSVTIIHLHMVNVEENADLFSLISGEQA